MEGAIHFYQYSTEDASSVAGPRWALVGDPLKTLDDADGCLHVEIIVVDGGSPDGTQALVPADVVMVEAPRGRGV